jgi:hypothetical protein
MNEGLGFSFATKDRCISALEAGRVSIDHYRSTIRISCRIKDAECAPVSSWTSAIVGFEDIILINVPFAQL